MNGEFVPVSIAQTATAEWTMSGDGFTFSMALSGADDVPPGAVVTLTRDREVTVSGDGFAPGTLVDVWLFSTPTYLGSVQVGADGRFRGALTVPATIAVGGHTLQANGATTDGNLRSLNLGVQVLDRNFSLPKTGSGGGLGVVALWLMAAGLFLIVARRRRVA
ncbi:MAG: LPXTG cell wall anchor domain-containing protein [Actinomycetota bacterium]